MLNVITSAKKDSIKINTAFLILFTYQRESIDSALYYANKIEQIGKEKNDSIITAMGLLNTAFAFGRKGNRILWMQNAFNALSIGENVKNKDIQAFAYNMLAAPESLVDVDKAFIYQTKAIELKDESKIDILLMLFYNNMANLYLRFDKKTDSALKYAGKAESCRIFLNDTFADIWVQKTLGDVYLKRQSYDQAKMYYSTVLKIALKTNWERDLVMAYSAIGSYFDSLHNKDSAFYYENKAFKSIYNKGYTTKIAPSKWLYKFYKDKNFNDSALKYLEITVNSTDSVLNDNTILQLKNLSLIQEQELKKREKEKADALEVRTKNIEIIIIGLIILSTVIVFLLLSRSIIVNMKLIKFLGIVELLIVFEFINFYMHPWLLKITHESPVLMLLSLVIVASLLIPIHERLQTWMIPKLLEMNETRRIAWARKILGNHKKKIEKHKE